MTGRTSGCARWCATRSSGPTLRGCRSTRGDGSRTQARAGSREHLANTASYITDVNQAAVETVLGDAGVTLMIHGHTHRPGVHRFRSGGQDRTRVVLGAWHDEANVVRWDDAGWQLLPCPV